MSPIVERTVSGCRQPRHQPERQKNRDELTPQRNDTEINYSQRDAQQVHSRQPEKSCRELGHFFGYIDEFGRNVLMRHGGADGRTTTPRPGSGPAFSTDASTTGPATQRQTAAA